MKGFTADYLRQSYLVEGKTDREISEELGVERTSVVHARKHYQIPTRIHTGLIGESIAKKALKEHGFNVMDMNEVSKTYSYDLLVNNHIRIEVKSAKESFARGSGCYYFTLSEKPTNGNIESPIRIELKNGRTRKLFRKTCDFLLLVGIMKNGINELFIVPSKDITDEQKTISISSGNNYQGKYLKYKDNWHQLKDFRKE